MGAAAAARTLAFGDGILPQRLFEDDDGVRGAGGRGGRRSDEDADAEEEEGKGAAGGALDEATRMLLEFFSQGIVRTSWSPSSYET